MAETPVVVEVMKAEGSTKVSLSTQQLSSRESVRFVVSICIVVQALDSALKQFKSSAPNTAVLLLSVDHDNNKILCLAQVPKVRRYTSTAQLKSVSYTDTH